MMSAKNLRDSILQMAVEGKLVEQRAEEGTAADLLASIREQRAKLVREKKAKLVKGGESVIWRDDAGHWFERRGKGEAICIDDEIPFDIPDSWCWARLETVLINRDAERIPVSIADRASRKKLYDYYGASGVIDAIDNYLFDKPLLLIGEDGANLLNRSTPVAFIARGKYWVNNHAHVLDGVSEQLLCYVALYINSISLAPFVSGTAQPKMNQRRMGTILIPLPPAKEQGRILARYEDIVPHVDEYGRAQKTREQLDHDLPLKLRKSILQAAVEGKLTEQSDDDEPASVLLAGIREQRAQLVREKKAKPVKGGESIIYRDAGHWFERRGKSAPVCIDDDIPFDIPDSWSWARLGALIELQSGVDLGKKDYSANKTDNSAIPYITGASNFQSGTVLENRWTVSPKRIATQGDLLFTCKGTVGEMAMNPFAKAHIARQVMAIRAVNPDMLSYIKIFLEYRVTEIKKSAKGVIPGIERGDILNSLAPVPPLAEQNCIVKTVDAALKQISALL